MLSNKHVAECYQAAEETVGRPQSLLLILLLGGCRRIDRVPSVRTVRSDGTQHLVVCVVAAAAVAAVVVAVVDGTGSSGMCHSWTGGTGTRTPLPR